MLEAPKDLQENLKFRHWVKLEAENNPDFKAKIKHYCKLDPIFYINAFLWTFDPRTNVFFSFNDIPFILFDKQEEYARGIVDAIMNNDNLACEKSRDEGATWIMLAISHWLWNFHEGGNVLLGSINKDAIHIAGNMSSLFPKLFYFNRFLHDWMLPAGFNAKEHQFYMRLLNPETGAAIIGDSSLYFGSSGRYRVVFFDELSKWLDGKDYIGWESCLQTARSLIAIATPNGQGNLYYQLVSNTSETAIKKIRIHWTDDPRKNKDLEYLQCDYADYDNSPTKNQTLYRKFKGKRSAEPKPGYVATSSWYRAECKRFIQNPEKGDQSIKQELDIYYLGSSETYFRQTVMQELMTNCKPPVLKGNLEYKYPQINLHDASRLAELKSNPYKDQKAVFETDSFGDFWIWEKPEPLIYDNHYAFACDYAKGLAKVNDYTVISVFNRRTRCVVARYVGKTEHADILCHKVWLYYGKGGMFNVDATGNSSLAIALDRMGVPLIKQIKGETGKETPSLGFNFTRSEKWFIFNSLKNHLYNKDFFEPDERFFLQSQTFVNDSGVLKGSGKGELQKHDDIIDCEALLLHCDDNMPDLRSLIIEKRMQEDADQYGIRFFDYDLVETNKHSTGRIL